MLPYIFCVQIIFRSAYADEKHPTINELFAWFTVICLFVT